MEETKTNKKYCPLKGTPFGDECNPNICAWGVRDTHYGSTAMICAIARIAEELSAIDNSVYALRG